MDSSSDYGESQTLELTQLQYETDLLQAQIAHHTKQLREHQQALSPQNLKQIWSHSQAKSPHKNNIPSLNNKQQENINGLPYKKYLCGMFGSKSRGEFNGKQIWKQMEVKIAERLLKKYEKQDEKQSQVMNGFLQDRGQMQLNEEIEKNQHQERARKLSICEKYHQYVKKQRQGSSWKNNYPQYEQSPIRIQDLFDFTRVCEVIVQPSLQKASQNNQYYPQQTKNEGCQTIYSNIALVDQSSQVCLNIPDSSSQSPTLHLHPISQETQTDIVTYSETECQTLGVSLLQIASVQDNQVYMIEQLKRKQQQFELVSRLYEESVEQIRRKDEKIDNLQIQIRQFNEQLRILSKGSDNFQEIAHNLLNELKVEQTYLSVFSEQNSQISQQIMHTAITQQSNFIEMLNFLTQKIQHTQQQYQQEFFNLQKTYQLEIQELETTLSQRLRLQELQMIQEQQKMIILYQDNMRQSSYYQNLIENRDIVINKHKETIAQYKEQIEKLQNQIMRRKSSQCVKEQGLMNELEKIIEELTEENNKLKQELKKCQLKCKEQNENYHQLANKYRLISIQSHEDKEKLVEEIKNLQECVQNIQTKLAVANQQSMKLKKEADKATDFQTLLKEQKNKMESLRNQNMMLLEQIDSLKYHYENCQKRENQVKKEIDEKIQKKSNDIMSEGGQKEVKEEEYVREQKQEKQQNNRVQAAQFLKSQPNLSHKNSSNHSQAKSDQHYPQIPKQDPNNDQQRKAKSQQNQSSYSPIPVKITSNQNRFVPIQQLSEQNRETVKVQEYKNNETDEIKSACMHKNDHNTSGQIYFRNYPASFEQEKHPSQKIEQEIQTDEKMSLQPNRSQDTDIKNRNFKVEKVISIECENPADSELKIESGKYLQEKDKKDINKCTKIVSQMVENSERPLNRTVHLVNTPVKSSVIDYQTNYNYSQSIDVANLTEQNKKLLEDNKKMLIQKRQMEQNLNMITKKWKKLKDQQNEGEDKLVQASQLKQKISLIIKNKEKMFIEFDHNDFEALCQEMDKLIKETNRWIQMLTFLTHQNKKRVLNESKVIRKKTIKVNKEISKSKSIYSEGNSPAKKYIDFDISPFEADYHDHEQHLNQVNTLQRLFIEDKDISEISSVKHPSENSSFINSRSEIMHIFQKEGNMFNKKDIVQEIANNQMQKEKVQTKQQQQQNNKNIFINKNTKFILPQGGLTKNFDEKSAKSKRKLINKTLIKMSIIQKKIDQNKKQYSELVSKIVSQYENKIKKMQKQFQQILNTVITNSQLSAKDNSTHHSQEKHDLSVSLPGRLHKNNEKEELTEKIEELEKNLEKELKENEKKEKAIISKNQFIADLEKKLKEEKVNAQKSLNSYKNEMITSSELKKMVTFLQQDFARFMDRIANYKSEAISQQLQTDPWNPEAIKELPHKQQAYTQTYAIEEEQTDKDQQQSNKKVQEILYNCIDNALKPSLSESRMSRRSEGKGLPSVYRKRSFSEVSDFQKQSIYKDIKKQVEEICTLLEVNTEKSENEEKTDTNDLLVWHLEHIKSEIKRQKKEFSQKMSQIKKRTFELIKVLIRNFKISERAIEKALQSKESESNTLKFIELRRDLKNFYETENQKDQQTKFNSYEEKYEKLEKELQMKTKQLNEKEQQLKEFRDKMHSFNQLKKNVSQQSLNNSNEDDTTFYEFEQKSEFSNLRPLKEEIQELKKDLSYYQRKCQEYEREKKKKKEVIYVRK